MGIFSKDYESAGVGISKHAPKKKGAALFFEILGRKFWKIMEVNFIYYLFFFPLTLVPVTFTKIKNLPVSLIATLLLILLFMVTIGPATAGVTKIMRKYTLEKNSFIIHDFFKAFKDNFAKSSVVGFVDVLLCISIYAGIEVYPVLVKESGSSLMYIPLIITLSLAIVVIMMNFYMFLMIIATDLSFKNLIKNSFALAFLDIKKSILTFFIVAAVIASMILFIPLFVLMVILPFFPFGILAFLVCFNSYPVIQKYVINPYYASIGQVNPELCVDDDDDDEPIFEDMGGKEKPIEKRKKGKGRRIS